MVRRAISFIVAVLSSTVLLATEACAQTPLNRAVLSTIRNQVQVLRQNQSPRAARISDVVTPGQGVSTARASLAELRFNDGSLGRLGEQVVFWFTPGTRNFRLSNGTALFLITPGQGRTRIQTPNATAGIQGSALFVRYIPETDTTIIGALTDSGIEVFNRDASQQESLRGGQMAVAVGNRIEQIYDFDLNTFYETSALVRGLAPTEERLQSTPRDATVSQVQEEMQTAIEQQSLPLSETIETPSFVRTPERSTAEPSITTPVFNNLPDFDQSNPPENSVNFPENRSIDPQPSNNVFDRDLQPPTPPAQNPLERVITDPRVDDRREPPDRRPGNGNGRPDTDDRPGNGRPDDPGNGRPDTGDRPGNGNGRPDTGDRPGNGNGRPDTDDRPGNGNGNGNGRPDNPGNGRPDVGDRPGNGNGRPDNPGSGRPDNPGNGNGRPDTGDRPGNGNGRPDNPGNGRPDVGDRPGNGNGRPDNPGNSDGRPDVGDRPGNGNGRPDNPGNGNGRPDTGDRPGNGNGRPDVGDRPGNGNGRPDNSGNGRPDNPGNGNGNGGPNAGDRPGNDNGRPNNPGNDNGRPNNPGNGNGRTDAGDRSGNGNGNGNGNNRPDRENERPY